MSSCKVEDEGDGEGRDSVEGSTDMMVVVERKEGLLYLHAIRVTTWHVNYALRKVTHRLLHLQSLHHSPMQTGFSLFVLRFGGFRLCDRWVNRFCVD